MQKLMENVHFIKKKKYCIAVEYILFIVKNECKSLSQKR